MIGFGFAQFHEAVHAVETVQVQFDPENSEPVPDQHEDDCLVCTLTITALPAGEHLVSSDFVFSEKLSLSLFFYIDYSATTHFRLRAPPSH